MKVFVLLFLIFTGCSQGRNLDGAPEPFIDPYYELSESTETHVENMYGLQPFIDGLKFKVYQTSSSGFYGIDLNFLINFKTLRFTIGNVNSGVLNCQMQRDQKLCVVEWLSDLHVYDFNIEKYQFQIEEKLINAILKPGSEVNGSFVECSLDQANSSSIDGKRTIISLIHKDSRESLRLVYYDFGPNNFGFYRSDISSNNDFYYSYNFDQHFNLVPYFFDAIGVYELTDQRLIQIGAKSIDNNINSSVNFCFYD